MPTSAPTSSSWKPLDGDPLRHLAGAPGTPECDHDYFWALDGRSKRSVALDLKSESARPVIDALVARADVLVTNYRPAIAERLGLDWARLKQLNPRLVYAQITGYGDTGPEADRPGYDTTAWWSRSGLADHVRNPGTRPAMSAPGMGDHATAMSLYGGIMTALWARERTGEGRRVTTSLFANGLWSNGMMASMALCGAEIPQRDPEAAIANALAVQYETADQRWLDRPCSTRSGNGRACSPRWSWRTCPTTSASPSARVDARTPPPCTRSCPGASSS
ncbi:MAG: CoA transferase [Gammaproteobacteria bacterium]|nr:CoA transferase [Gammaproteobacteria bacterium]